MKVTVYHKVDPAMKDKILTEGIKREEESQKTDQQKKKVDAFLDSHRPEAMKEQGIVSRQNAVYGYIELERGIIDIDDGEWVAVDVFADGSEQLLLRLTVDAEVCYVADLDLYDTIGRALELDEQDSTREHLADRYWQRLTPIGEFQASEIKRPEIMIVADISPDEIEIVESN